MAMDLFQQKINFWRLVFKCNVTYFETWCLFDLPLPVTWRLIFVVVSQTTSLHSGATTTLWTTVRWCRPTTCARSCPGSWTASTCPGAAPNSPAETTTSTSAERSSQAFSCRSVCARQVPFQLTLWIEMELSLTLIFIVKWTNTICLALHACFLKCSIIFLFA